MHGRYEEAERRISTSARAPQTRLLMLREFGGRPLRSLHAGRGEHAEAERLARGALRHVDETDSPASSSRRSTVTSPGYSKQQAGATKPPPPTGKHSTSTSRSRSSRSPAAPANDSPRSKLLRPETQADAAPVWECQASDRLRGGRLVGPRLASPDVGLGLRLSTDDPSNGRRLTRAVDLNRRRPQETGSPGLVQTCPW